jgi:hypothetical protein
MTEIHRLAEARQKRWRLLSTGHHSDHHRIAVEVRNLTRDLNGHCHDIDLHDYLRGEGLYAERRRTRAQGRAEGDD